MLSIILDRKPVTLHTADGSLMPVRRAYLRHRGAYYLLQKFPACSAPPRVRFVVRRWNKYRRLPRIERLERAVSEFLHRKQDMLDIKWDCYRFVCAMHGLPTHSQLYLSQHWKLLAPGAPQPGDVVFLLTEAAEGRSFFHHAAVYVGDGFYLSVWGAGGHLEAATLGDMRKGFKAAQVMRAIPR